MRYPDGVIVKVGDVIWWDEGASVGKVAEIVETPDSLNAWGVEHPGILICCNPLRDLPSCDVFHPQRLFFDEGVAVLTDAEKANLYESNGSG